MLLGDGNLGQQLVLGASIRCGVLNQRMQLGSLLATHRGSPLQLHHLLGCRVGGRGGPCGRAVPRLDGLSLEGERLVGPPALRELRLDVCGAPRRIENAALGTQAGWVVALGNATTLMVHLLDVGQDGRDHVG